MRVRRTRCGIGKGSFPVGVPAVAAGSLAVHALPALALVPGGRAVFPTVRRVEIPGRVALSFDDGPEPSAIEMFLALLDELGVKATFFLVGEQVRRAGDAPRSIVEAGHEVACHGDRHRNHLRLGPVATLEDLRRARETIEEATGVQIELFRPPYGVFNITSWTAAGAFGWERVLWARWGRDWEATASPDSIRQRVLDGLRGGDVILLHDAERYSAPGSWRRTLGALRPLVEGLRERGLEPGTVGELLRPSGAAADDPSPGHPLAPPASRMRTCPPPARLPPPP